MALDSAINSRTKKRDNGVLAMAARSHATTRSPLNSEVSLSFQDELAAAIHGAFEVAVEIAVVEITKLVGQALGDVRDQMHETVRENKTLKIRLQASEQKLDALRCTLDGERQLRAVTTGTNRSGRVQQAHHRKTTKHRNVSDKTKSKPPRVIGASATAELQEAYGFFVETNDTCVHSNGSFSEIREDGRVCSQSLTEELGPDQVTSHDLRDPSDTKENCISVNSENHMVAMKQDEESPAEAAEVDSSPSLYVSSQNCDVDQVVVKEENEMMEQARAFASAQVTHGDFGADSLSMAQFKLLEDWRPKPLELNQGCDAAPCSSRSLSDAAVLNPDTAAAEGLFAAPFPVPYQAGDGAVGSGPQPSYGTPRVHACRMCGEVFHLPADLRKHYSQQHGNAPAKRRQPFPPGRSPYHCSLCGRDFNRMENLKTHLRIHTGERPYACSECGMRFRHSGALTRHFRIHTGEKPYSCSQCGKAFRNCGGLRFHQRSHTREGHGGPMENCDAAGEGDGERKRETGEGACNSTDSQWTSGNVLL